MVKAQNNQQNLPITFNSTKFSFHLESSYNNASVTSRKDFVFGSTLVDRVDLPKPFNNLVVIKTSGSCGKCWIFHKSKKGNFKGYLFSSGYRILHVKQTSWYCGEYFLENRNFLRSKYGLLGAIIPKKPTVGNVYNCELILISKLYMDEIGNMKIKYQRYLDHGNQHDSLNTLMNQGEIQIFFKTYMYRCQFFRDNLYEFF